MASSTGKKGRKAGRDKKKCEKYRASGVRERNKTKKAKKEEKRQAKFKVRRELRAQVKEGNDG